MGSCWDFGREPLLLGALFLPGSPLIGAAPERTPAVALDLELCLVLGDIAVEVVVVGLLRAESFFMTHTPPRRRRQRTSFAPPFLFETEFFRVVGPRLWVPLPYILRTTGS